MKQFYCLYSKLNQNNIKNNNIKNNNKNINSNNINSKENVVFSRGEIYEVKRMIELNTNKKCCVIYGGLPPENRNEQAELFNDPHSGYNVLVSSDAVGIGLNLNIKRIVFYKLKKFDAKKMDTAPLEKSLVKQIAGRAGRRGFHEIGEVTTFKQLDLQFVSHCLNSNVKQTKTVGVFLEYEQLEIFLSSHLLLEEIRNSMNIKLVNALETYYSFCKIHQKFFSRYQLNSF
jgi:ATP-dependent RNA helicase SUPV3L1/SUV3